MKRLKNYADDKDVRAAKEQLNEHKIRIRDLQDELAEAQREGARLYQEALDAKADNIVGDASDEEVAAAREVEEEAAELTARKERELEENQRAVSRLESKVRQAEKAAIERIRAVLEREHEAARRALADALTAAQGRLDELVEIERQYEPNKIALPLPRTLNNGPTVYLGHGGKAVFAVEDWLRKSGTAPSGKQASTADVQVAA